MDTTLWIQLHSDTFKKYGDSARIIAWMHTHVGGNECFFSSVDVHTQLSIQSNIPNAIGIVMEISEFNTLENVEYYKLSEFGVKHVSKCKESGLQMHPNCHESNLYTSVKQLIKLDNKIPIRTKNFSTLNTTCKPLPKKRNIDQLNQPSKKAKQSIVEDEVEPEPEPVQCCNDLESVVFRIN